VVVVERAVLSKWRGMVGVELEEKRKRKGVDREMRLEVPRVLRDAR
jgi:hypothetical protein